jgi:hypothetical protein
MRAVWFASSGAECLSASKREYLGRCNLRTPRLASPYSLSVAARAQRRLSFSSAHFFPPGCCAAFVASGFADVLPYQLFVCAAVGTIVALAVWLISFGQ